MRESVIEDAPTRAENGLAPAGYVPRSADARSPVVVIRVVQATVGDLNVGSGGSIEIREIAMLFLNDSEVVVAQAQVEGEVSSHADAVLHVTCVGILKGIAIGVA